MATHKLSYTGAEVETLLKKAGEAMPKSGGTFTGNVSGKYFTGTWLQTTATTDLGKTPPRIAVIDASGWIYYRTPAEILDDIGAASKDDIGNIGAILDTINGETI